MGVIVGVDGGGSKTVVAVVERDGGTINTGTVGPSNPYAIGFDAARATLTSAITATVAAAGRDAGEVEAIAIGLAGVDSEAASSALWQWLTTLYPTATCSIVNDAELVLTAGTPHGIGVAIIAGTGSIAVGLDAAGTRARAGGWGRILGDDGSGYQVGLAGLRAAALALEGRGEGTRLIELLRVDHDVSSVADVIQRVRSSTPADIAAIASLVATAAEAGDPIAGAILSRASADLAAIARVVIHQLRWSQPFPMALGGGLLRDWSALRARVVDRLRSEEPGLGPVETVPEPVAGAVLLARRSLAGAGGTR